MRNLILILSIVISTSLIIGCSKSKEAEPESQYKQSIIGTWELTHYDNKPVSSLPEVFNKTTAITFGSNGSYSADGVFGVGSGTYTLKGSSAVTYIDKKEYNRYEILSLKDGIVEAKMTDSSGSAVIKAKKTK